MDTLRYQKKDLDQVVDALNHGKVIAFPTDTVFGLGVRYDDETALNRLKQAKIRPDSKPIPMMVASFEQVKMVAEVSAKAERLMNAFMPGAFTIVLKKKSNVADYITNGLATIAIRMPADDFVLSLMTKMNCALLVSSANISSQHSCQSASEVLEQLNGRIDGIVLGESGNGVASTIVDASMDTFHILREGPISKEMIEEVWEERL